MDVRHNSRSRFCMNFNNSHTAFLFDLDGTLINSEYLYAETLKNVLKKQYGIDISTKESYLYVCGHSNDHVFSLLIMNGLIKEEKNRSIFLKEFDNAVEKNLASIDPHKLLINPFVNLLKSLVAENQKTCIVSGSSRKSIDLALEKMGLKNRVLYIGAENYKMSKPDPEPYLVARQLFADCSRFIVFEDSLAGVKSAHSAGMYVIGVEESLRSKLLAEGANYVLTQNQVAADNLRQVLKEHMESTDYRTIKHKETNLNQAPPVSRL